MKYKISKSEKKLETHGGSAGEVSLYLLNIN